MKKANQYVVVDANILRLITEGHSVFCEIWTAVDAFLEPVQGVDVYRMVDGRLQALRKRGLITYSRRDGWKLGAKQ